MVVHTRNEARSVYRVICHKSVFRAGRSNRQLRLINLTGWSCCIALTGRYFCGSKLRAASIRNY